MRILKAISIAFSTYSVLPMPHFEWSEENLRFSLCTLPLVGLPIGALLLLWDRICTICGIGPVLFAAAAAVLPILVTGGIHMDGFCDTVDAISSRQTKERKLVILKDPRMGAFAAVYASVYLLLCFGLFSELIFAAAINAVCLGFVFTRALTVLSAIIMPNARKTGMLAAFKTPMQRHAALTVTVLFLLFCAVGMAVLHLLTGFLCIILGGAWLLLYRRICMRNFGGVTGDTTGFFLQVMELFVLLGANLAVILERTV